MCYNAVMQYTVVRSARKTLSLTVTRTGEVVVRAPMKLGEQYIADFVARHAAWLEKRLAAVAARPRLDLSDGARLELFGSAYTIQTGKAQIGRGALLLPAEGREEALAALLKKFSAEVMTTFTAHVAGKHGFCFQSVRISSARGRWGSCNRKGVIAYTFRVAFLPPRLVEYVVVHELSHTKVFDHSPAFWKTVERVLPDYKARRKALRANPAIGFL